MIQPNNAPKPQPSALNRRRQKKVQNLPIPAKNLHELQQLIESPPAALHLDNRVHSMELFAMWMSSH
ncbi:MAG: hypothetical protein GXO82_10775 [Chlorobi bacterium]|nr:hypothetical protein [Chlorobiota bacterium]